MTQSNILKQRARTPKPSDAAAWARSKAALKQMVETERRKDRTDRQRGRAADRLDCCANRVWLFAVTEGA